MNQGKYVFAQIFEFVPQKDFLKFVKKYGGERNPLYFSCWNQFLWVAFNQRTTYGVLIQEYRNLQPKIKDGVNFDEIENAFEKDKLEELPLVELKNLKIETIPLP